jgi:nucleotide-binding universal stress UspA family protein
MDKILFPTDFSNNALNALDYALEFANVFKSKLVMIHAVNVPSKVGTFTVLERKMVEDAEKELENWVARAKNKLHNPDALVAKVVKGNVLERIETVAKQFDCDLILVSAKGEGDADDKYLGRISAGLVKKTNIPILIVPIVYRFRPIKSIVFSIKFKRVSSPKVVEPLIKIATKFDAAVSVLHVKTPDFDPSRDENLFLDELPHKLYNLEGNFIFDTTKAFIEDHPIDMLVAIRRKRGFFKNIIFNNGTKKKTFNSEVPFLVLQGKK